MSDDQTLYDHEAKALVVSHLEITDADVLREATRWSTGVRGEPIDPAVLYGTDLSNFVLEALSVGARVLSIASQSSDTLAVQQAVKSASESMTATARDVHTTLSDTITKYVGGESPELLERLRPIMAKVGADLEQQMVAGLRQAREADAQETERRHRELSELLHTVRQEVAVKVAEDASAALATDAIKSVTTIKGFDYETQVNDVCIDLAAAMGDEYLAVGETAGRLPRNKKGDGVFNIGGGLARVVVECHDGSTKEWGSYLAEAERNRGASASIGLVRHARDNAGSLVRVIAPKRVVLAYNPDVDDDEMLRTIVLLMRTVAMTSSGRFGTEQVATANEGIREALALLDDLDDAKRSAAAIRGHVDKIEQTVTKVMAGVQRELHGALNALTGIEATTDQANQED
jgi:hypothetical protein